MFCSTNDLCVTDFERIKRDRAEIIKEVSELLHRKLGKNKKKL
jgi:phenylpyruvate tautomerase PptA (4-oxalocrotonate tautomerase family)